MISETLPLPFEVVIPLRNPGEVFKQTINSLISQQTRCFSVLLSDNFSTIGSDIIADSVDQLLKAGIPCRLIRPDQDLDRVSHWNWAHFSSSAKWLKPLFVGDYLEPNYFSEIASITSFGYEGLILCRFTMHKPDSTHIFECGGLKGTVPTDTALRRAILEGNIFGGPLNVVYPRSFFEAVGGHSTTLPFIADFELYTKMASSRESYVVDLPLAHFVVHSARYSSRGSKMQRSSPQAEWLLLTLSLIYSALCRHVSLPWRPVLFRLFGMQLQICKSLAAHYSHRSSEDNV